MSKKNKNKNKKQTRAPLAVVAPAIIANQISKIGIWFVFFVCFSIRILVKIKNENEIAKKSDSSKFPKCPREYVPWLRRIENLLQSLIDRKAATGNLNCCWFNWFNWFNCVSTKAKMEFYLCRKMLSMSNSKLIDWILIEFWSISCRHPEAKFKIEVLFIII